MNSPGIVFILALLGAVTALSRPAAAHLGETEKQLIAHYGRVTSSLKDPAKEQTITFEKPGRLVIAKLMDGKCVSITTTAIGGGFTGAEVQEILREHSQGSKWTHPNNGGDIWVRGDGAIAYVTHGSVDIVRTATEGFGSPAANGTPKLDLKPAPPVGAAAPAGPSSPAGALPTANTSTPASAVPPAAAVSGHEASAQPGH